MPLLQLVIWGLVFLIALAIVLSSQLIGLLLMLVIAGLVGALARAVIPGRLPSGWGGALLAGRFVARPGAPRILGSQSV